MFIRYKTRKRTTWEWFTATEAWTSPNGNPHPARPVPDGFKTREVWSRGYFGQPVGYVTQWCVPGRATGGLAVSAILIEAERIDGEPRQQHIGSLGTLSQVEPRVRRDNTVTVPGGYAKLLDVADFWTTALERLDELVPDDEERKAVVRMLKAKIRKPTKVEVRVAQREWQKRSGALGRATADPAGSDLCTSSARSP